jgi:hypothetical protein
MPFASRGGVPLAADHYRFAGKCATHKCPRRAYGCEHMELSVIAVTVAASIGLSAACGYVMLSVVFVLVQSSISRVGK